MSGSVRVLHGLMRRDANGIEPVNRRGYGPALPQIVFDTTGKHPQLTFPNVGAEVFGSDIKRYNIVSTYSENNFDEEGTLDVVRVDGNYKFDTEHLQSVDVGLRHSTLHVTRDTWIMTAPFTLGGVTKNVIWKDSGATFANTNGDATIDVSKGDLTLGKPWLFTDLPAGWVTLVTDFGPVSGKSIYFVDPKVMDDPWAFQNALYPNNQKIANPNDSYKVDERTQSAYIKANFSSSAGEISYNANIGVQYVRTELDIFQNMAIDYFIEIGSSTIRVKDGDGVERRSVPVKGNVNDKGGTIKEVEVAYQQSFDFLPDFWSGLGAGLNMTYAPSESGAVDFYQATLPIADNSERSGNAVLWYEPSGVPLRVAAHYRSERLATNGTVFGVSSRLPIWTEPTTYIDLSGSYDFTDNFTAYASVSNLTEEYENNYLQWEGNVISQNIYERRMTVGIRARF